MNKQKPYWYIVWIEGLSLKTGEKLSKGTSYDLERRQYSVKMTEAIRVKPADLPIFKERLKAEGVSATFHRTNYAPTGTIWCKYFNIMTVKIDNTSKVAAIDFNGECVMEAPFNKFNGTSDHEFGKFVGYMGMMKSIWSKHPETQLIKMKYVKSL